MHPIEVFLAGSCASWNYDEHRAKWHELLALVEALSDAEAAHWIPMIDARLAQAYGTGTCVYFEDDQRVAPLSWMFPIPRPQLALARDLTLQMIAHGIDAAALLASARAPVTRAITYLRIEDGDLAPIFSELLASPLCDGLELLSLRGATIGGDDGAALIAATPSLARLGALDLSFTNVHEEGVEALLASPHLQTLERFVVDANCIDPYGERGPAYWDELNAKLDARRIEMVFV